MLTVIQCVVNKRPGTHRAVDLYIGKFFTTCLQAARCLTADDHIRILSGKHGLLRLDELVHNYDEMISPSIEPILRTANVDVETCFLQKRYAIIARRVWPDATYVFDGSRGGISQLVRCYKIIKEHS